MYPYSPTELTCNYIIKVIPHGLNVDRNCEIMLKDSDPNVNYNNGYTFIHVYTCVINNDSLMTPYKYYVHILVM